jgi:hypothetical protein
LLFQRYNPWFCPPIDATAISLAFPAAWSRDLEYHPIFKARRSLAGYGCDELVPRCPFAREF